MTKLNGIDRSSFGITDPIEETEFDITRQNLSNKIVIVHKTSTNSLKKRKWLWYENKRNLKNPYLGTGYDRKFTVIENKTRHVTEMIKKLLWWKVKNNRVIEKLFSTNLNLEIKLDEHRSSCTKLFNELWKKVS